MRILFFGIVVAIAYLVLGLLVGLWITLAAVVARRKEWNQEIKRLDSDLGTFVTSHHLPYDYIRYHERRVFENLHIWSFRKNDVQEWDEFIFTMGVCWVVELYERFIHSKYPHESCRSHQKKMYRKIARRMKKDKEFHSQCLLSNNKTIRELAEIVGVKK